MRELLLTITLLSVVSSEEYEAKKRTGIPLEEDPDFWPTRGRRSYWGSPRLISNLIHRDLPQRSEFDYSGRSRSWADENDLASTPEVVGVAHNWRVNLCPRKKSVSLVLPLREYLSEESDLRGNGGRCSGQIRGRGRREDEHWRKQQPLYVEEPGWISINWDHGVLGGSMGDADPFIVARGKKRSEEVFGVRERRQLEDVLSSYDTDPFFVARGKRNIDFKDFGLKDEELGSSKKSFEVNVGNKFASKLRKRRWIESEDKKGQNSEDGGVNRKFFIPEEKKKSGKNGKPVLTTRGVEGNDENHRRRLQRSSTEAFETDRRTWMGKNEGHTSDEFSGVKSRYSRPRDKHSNLQSILDEPFFVSRGKKNEEYHDGSEYLRYDKGEGEEESPIKIEEEEIESRDPRSVRKIFKTLYLGENSELFKKSDEKFKDQDKTPRNRRGMLDELLKSDDPFYVARGKRIDPQPRPCFYVTINTTDDDTRGKPGKFSLFAKTRRTKLLQDISDFSKTRSEPSEGERDFKNLADNSINGIN